MLDISWRSKLFYVSSIYCPMSFTQPMFSYITLYFSLLTYVSLNCPVSSYIPLVLSMIFTYLPFPFLEKDIAIDCHVYESYHLPSLHAATQLHLYLKLFPKILHQVKNCHTSTWPTQIFQKIQHNLINLPTLSIFWKLMAVKEKLNWSSMHWRYRALFNNWKIRFWYYNVFVRAMMEWVLSTRNTSNSFQSTY